MTNSWPVQKPDSSEARNSTRLATSVGVPRRPTGNERASRSRLASSLMAGIPETMSVSMMPGCTELTLIPSRPNSLAATLVMPRTAHFDAP